VNKDRESDMADIEKRRGSGVRVAEGAVLVVVGVVGIVIAFAVLHTIVGFVWEAVKVVVVVGLIGAAIWFLGRRRRR
jgi:Flp pilus assembly protein TadB